MAKTAAQRMRESRDRKRNSATHQSATDVAQQASATGPLDVYSEQRWAFLQSRGHVWDANRQRSTRPAEHGSIVVGVAVPGDPGYEHGPGVCRQCGEQTEAEAETKCLRCVMGGEVAA